MQQPFRMPPMGPGQQRPTGPGQQRPTGSMTDVAPRRPPRTTHRWDPERGVVPIDPNAPAQFVPPPPPEVIQAYMQGMARRQGVARDLGNPAALPPDPPPMPIPNARSLGRIDPRTGAQGLMGVMPGMDNQAYRWLPAPENMPMPIPTMGWQNQGLVLPPGQGRY